MPIARPKRAPQRSRDRALLAAHVERRAAFILRDDDDARVAGEPLDRFERRVGSPRPSMEGCFVDVHDELVAIGRRRRSPTPTSRRRRRDTSSRSPPAHRLVGSGSPTAIASAHAVRNFFLLQRPLDRLHDELANIERQLHAQAQRAARGIAPRRQRARLPRAPRVVHGVRVHIANLPAALLDLRRRGIECVADAARPRRAAPPRASARAPSCTTAALRETRARSRGRSRNACAVRTFSRAADSEIPQRHDSHSAQLGKLHFAQPMRSSNSRTSTSNW